MPARIVHKCRFSGSHQLSLAQSLAQADGSLVSAEPPNIWLALAPYMVTYFNYLAWVQDSSGSYGAEHDAKYGMGYWRTSASVTKHVLGHFLLL